MSYSKLDATGARTELYAIFNSDRSFDEKVERALTVGETYLNVDNGHLARIDPDTNYWRAIASTDPPDGAFPVGTSIEYESTYCRLAVSAGGLLALENAPEQGLADDPAFKTHGLHCYHGTVIYVDGDPYGTVCFVSEEPRESPFSEVETTFAELLTRMLEHDLRVRSLEAKGERFAEALDVICHDLRNPLSIAAGWLSVEREDRETKPLIEMSRALERMNELIESTLSVARQTSAVEETELTSLSQIANEAWRTARTGDGVLRVDSDCRFHADRTRLRQALENLFRNAIEHGGSVVRVGAIGDGDGFFVEDDGPGIDPAHRGTVFESGFTTGEEGVGLGLTIVEGIAEAHGWTISATEAAPGGARFEIGGITGARINAA